MKTARIYTNDFNRIISATKSFVSKNEVRKECEYIKLEFNAETSIVTATAIDGYRISVEHSVISNCENSFVAYIKPNVKLPSKKYAVFNLDGEELTMRCNGFIFGYEQPKITAALDTEKILKSVVSDAPSMRIGFNGNYLLEALQAAKASAGDSFRSPVVLEFTAPANPVVIRTNKEDIKVVLPVRLKAD